MSKKCRAAAADRRLREKRARKNAQKARYTSYRDSGNNSKRKTRMNAKSGRTKLRERTGKRNRRRTVDEVVTMSDGTQRTVMRGGTVSFTVFNRIS